MKNIKEQRRRSNHRNNILLTKICKKFASICQTDSGRRRRRPNSVSFTPQTPPRNRRNMRSVRLPTPPILNTPPRSRSNSLPTTRRSSRLTSPRTPTESPRTPIQHRKRSQRERRYSLGTPSSSEVSPYQMSSNKTEPNRGRRRPPPMFYGRGSPRRSSRGASRRLDMDNVDESESDE